jgi:hypothetical protein
MEQAFAWAMPEAASAHKAATATHPDTSQQRIGRTRRTSADPQRAQQGATSAASAAPAALDSLSRLQQLADASPQVAQLRRLQALADGRSAPVAQLAGPLEEEEFLQGKFAPAQLQHQLRKAPRANNTGLPDNLNAGIESLSGLSLAHVKVHYNSSQPAQLNALAYAQGSDIHLAPGQAQLLPHEAWHVVQQAKGRVQPNMQIVGGVAVNDDAGLEREADVMGARALRVGVLQCAKQENGEMSNMLEFNPKLSLQCAQLGQTHALSSSPDAVIQGVWNVAEITRQKSELDGRNFFPGGAGGSALHHIISRDSIKKFSRALAMAKLNNIEEAEKFWETAKGATNNYIRRQSHGLEAKILENMPLNLSYGPINPLNDPGVGFDPDTVEGETGARVMTPVSAQLSIINDLIENNTVEILGGEESGLLWEQANTALRRAKDSYGDATINAPNKEQWLSSGNGADRRFFRKGLYGFLGAAVGADRFLRTPIPVLAEIGMRAPNDEVDEETPENFSTWTYAAPANLSHFLARHTYAYFTFVDADIKLVNTFWPVGTTAENIIAYADAAMLYVHSYVTDLFDNKEEDEKLPGFVGIKNVRVPNVPKPVYLMFGIEEVRENVFQMDLRTLAPDGAVDAYTAESLREIRATFQ